MSGIGCGRKIDATENVNTFTTTFDAIVVNQDQLDESGRNKRSTRQELKLPGKIEVGIDIDAEDEEEAEDEEVINKSSPRGLFHCPNEGKKFIFNLPCYSESQFHLDCECKFLRVINLEKHLSNGFACKVYEPHPTMEDHVKTKYISCYGAGRFAQLRTSSSENAKMHMEDLPSLDINYNLPMSNDEIFEGVSNIFQEGHALPMQKKRSVFSRLQEDYIKSIFEAGRKQQKKACPQDVAKMMRLDKRFRPQDWLTESQIKSLFSKISTKIRQGTANLDKEDQTALEDEMSELQDAIEQEQIVDDITNEANNDVGDHQTIHPMLVG